MCKGGAGTYVRWGRGSVMEFQAHQAQIGVGGLIWGEYVRAPAKSGFG